MAANPTIASYRPSKISPQHRVLPDAPPGGIRPSWLMLVVATAAVAGLTWGIMQQRMPDIDPRQVIAINLAAAKLAVENERYFDPPEHSATHHFRSVLALDPYNQEALSGLGYIADRLIDQAKTAILEARFAEAALAIERVRRVQPTHRRLEFLESELNKGLEAHVAALQATAASAAANEAKPRASMPAKARAPRASAAIEARDAALTQAQLAIDASQWTEARARIDEARKQGAGEQQITALMDRLNAGQGGTAQGEPPISATPSSSPSYDDVAHAYQVASQQIRLQTRMQSTAVAAMGPSRSEASIATAAPAPLKAIKLVEPNYPQAAQVRGIEGWVDLTLTVAPSGEVIDARIENREGSRSFERAALLAVRQWKYEPNAAGSNAPAQQIPVRVGFKLE